jgi:hypothetical protein
VNSDLLAIGVVKFFKSRHVGGGLQPSNWG